MNRAVLVVVLAISACNAGSATPAPQPQEAPKTPDASARVGAAAGASVGAAAGASVGSSKPVGPVDPTKIDPSVGLLEGKPMYAALCAPCHGADAKGYAADHAPSLINPTFLETASDEFLRRSIAAGRPGTSMAAYGKAFGGPLDDAGVLRLVGYLRGMGPAARPLPAVAPGDVAAGSAIYAKHCVACHGDTRTRGEAVALANPQFQAAASAAFVRHAVVAGRPGTKMEAFAGKLSNADIDNVVSYVRAFDNHGAPAVTLLPAPTGKEPLVINPSGAAPSFTLRAEPCPPATAGGMPCTPDPRFVSIDQVAKAMAAKRRMVIIDARPPSDWMRMHATGAVSIPYHDLKRLEELPKDGTWVIAYCACPHHLSGIVVDELRKRGYKHTAVLDEGIIEWQRRDYPVVAAEGVTKPPPPPSPMPTMAPARPGDGTPGPTSTPRPGGAGTSAPRPPARPTERPAGTAQ